MIDQELTKKLKIFCQDWRKEDPYILTEYKNTFNDISRRCEIYTILNVCYLKGWDLDVQDVYDLWSFLSGEWRCSGWRSINMFDNDKLSSVLDHCVEILRYKGYIK